MLNVELAEQRKLEPFIIEDNLFQNWLNFIVCFGNKSSLYSLVVIIIQLLPCLQKIQIM